MDVVFTPKFIRDFKTLEYALQIEVAEKIELFKDVRNHKKLKVHKLRGRLSGRYSFYVNYQYRIVFGYTNKKTAILYRVGDHVVYN